MPGLHNEARPLDADKIKELEDDLKNLQGNILRGHGRDHAFHLFLTFNENKMPEVKKWIQGIAEHITSAHQQREEAIEYTESKGNIHGETFCNFLLSAEGYEALKYTGTQIPGDQAFRKGLKNKRDKLNYSKVQWEEEYNSKIHALFIIADDDKDVLIKKKKKYIEQLKLRSLITDSGYFVEEGQVLRSRETEASGQFVKSNRQTRQTYEHFGFRDNISQPLFFEKDVADAKDLHGGTSKWNPGAGPDLVLVKDPNTPQAHGSYLVFLKLEQDVKHFQDLVEQYASELVTLGLNKDMQEAREKAKALIMGRDPNGRPLLPSNNSIMPGDSAYPVVSTTVDNNFTFPVVDEEPSLEKQPGVSQLPQSVTELLKPTPSFRAHIRRMNPRGEFSRSLRRPSWYDRRYRIARRGMPYSEQDSDKNDKSVGLLFMCYQKDISVQFELLQKAANATAYLGKDVGSDVIMELVTLKGGEYFFAPSIPFLKTIA